MFIWLLAITSAYRQVRLITEFYYSIPKEIYVKFGLMLIAMPQNPKYNFMQLYILNTISDITFELNIDKKDVLITIFNDIEEIDDFSERMPEINRKYKNLNVTLTGWGLRKTVTRKDWNSTFQFNIEEVINELHSISREESFKIIE